MLEQTVYTHIKLLICHVVRHRVNFMGFVPIFICPTLLLGRAYFSFLFNCLFFFLSSLALSLFCIVAFVAAAAVTPAPFGAMRKPFARSLFQSEITWYYKRTRVLLKVLSILAFLWLFCRIEHLYAFRSRNYLVSASRHTQQKQQRSRVAKYFFFSTFLFLSWLLFV